MVSTLYVGTVIIHIHTFYKKHFLGGDTPKQTFPPKTKIELLNDHDNFYIISLHSYATCTKVKSITIKLTNIRVNNKLTLRTSRVYSLFLSAQKASLSHQPLSSSSSERILEHPSLDHPPLGHKCYSELFIVATTKGTQRLLSRKKTFSGVKLYQVNLRYIKHLSK